MWEWCFMLTSTSTLLHRWVCIHTDNTLSDTTLTSMSHSTVSELRWRLISCCHIFTAGTLCCVVDRRWREKQSRLIPRSLPAPHTGTGTCWIFFAGFSDVIIRSVVVVIVSAVSRVSKQVNCRFVQLQLNVFVCNKRNEMTWADLDCEVVTEHYRSECMTICLPCVGSGAL